MTATGAHVSETPVFERIVCGVDGTPASLVAVRQALRLQDEGGRLFLSAVANLAKAAHAGVAAPHAAELLQNEAEAALARRRGVSRSPRGRLQGLKALGSVSDRVAHQARSSVLVIRPRQA